MQTLLVLTILGLITGDPIVGLLGGAGAGHGSEQEQGHHGVGHSPVLHGDRRHDYTIQYLPSHHGYTLHHPHTVEHIVRRSVEAKPSNKIQELGESKDVLQDRSGLFGYGYVGYGLGGYGLGYGGLGLWKRSADEEVETSLHKSKRSANPYYGLGFGGLYGLGGFGYGFGGLYGHGLYGGHFWKRSSDQEEKSLLSLSKRSAEPFFGGYGYGGFGHHHHHHHYSHHGYGHW